MTSNPETSLETRNLELEEENTLLKKKIEELEERLKSYNCSERYKKYYQNESNAEKVKERNKSYLKKIMLICDEKNANYKKILKIHKNETYYYKRYNNKNNGKYNRSSRELYM